MPSAANLDQVRQATLCLVNRVRAQHRRGALLANMTLERPAQRYSQVMVNENFYGHVSPSGSSLLSRMLATSYGAPTRAGLAFGENLGWDYANLATPARIVQGWVNSPDHYANMLNSRFRDSGIGITLATPAELSGDGNGAIYVQDFGFIPRPPGA